MKLTRMDYYLSDRKASMIIAAPEQKIFITIEPSAPRRCRTLEGCGQRQVSYDSNYNKFPDELWPEMFALQWMKTTMYYPTPEESLQAALTAASIRQTEERR